MPLEGPNIVFCITYILCHLFQFEPITKVLSLLGLLIHNHFFLSTYFKSFYFVSIFANETNHGAKQGLDKRRVFKKDHFGDAHAVLGGILVVQL